MSAIIATIGKRGQITLPHAIRSKLNLQPGDQVALVVTGEQVVLHPLGGTLLELRGSVAVDGPQDLPAVRRRAKAARAKKRGQDGD